MTRRAKQRDEPNEAIEAAPPAAEVVETPARDKPARRPRRVAAHKPAQPAEPGDELEADVAAGEAPEQPARRARRSRRSGRELPRRLPVLPLINTVVFPRMTVPLLVEAPASVAALLAAQTRGPLILLVAQRDESIRTVTQADLYRTGTVAQVLQSIRVPDGGMQVVVQGISRARVVECVDVPIAGVSPKDPSHTAPVEAVVLPETKAGAAAPATEPAGEPSEAEEAGEAGEAGQKTVATAYLEAKIEPIAEAAGRTLATEALMRTVVSQLEQFIERGRGGHPDVLNAARNIEEPGWLADVAAFGPELTVVQRQQLLEIEDATERLRAVSVFLTHQLEILDLKNKIQGEIQKGMEKTQREYFLREQLKAIHRELGEGDPQQAELAELRTLVDDAGMPEEVHARAVRELERLPLIPPGSPEVGIVRTYVDWLVCLPWAKETDDQLDLRRAMQILNEDHYGLDKVKDRIVEFLAVRRLSGKLRSPILCFAGPPGVGKTSLGRSIARAMGRKFVRVSLGGVRDEAEIRGHRRTYVGAMPGRVVRGMRDAASRNPVFMLDEIDKLGRDFRGDPSSALLEVLDPEQNHSFSDHYLEVPFDLSRVLFITTANLIEPIPPALRDRMEIITIPGYTEDEKVQIAKRFVVPRQLDQHGIGREQLTITDEALRHLIREYTREAGVRNLEREVAHVCRKIARRIAESDGAAAGAAQLGTVVASDLERYLGPPKFDFGADLRKDEVGVAYGLAVTEVGGDLIEVEAAWMPRRDDRNALTLTGQLGDVMQESVQAAFSYARARGREFGATPAFFERHALHVHVPAGGVPKDGPSAGITMVTAIVSALSGRPVRSDVAMTGEITLRGKVMPIGGVKQKALAAHRAGIKTIVLPAENKKDLPEIPADVRKGLRIVWVDRMDQVLQHALHPVAVAPPVPHDLPEALAAEVVRPGEPVTATAS
ncbi:MAG: endopeptidase La [Chloroflexi bacterium]|nr:endopeptidase La [Chloroflexota bacterium]